MSLCYDFKKWTIISLSSVAISLTVGLVLMQVVHGQLTDSKYITCIIMEMTGIQVVLETSEYCPIELGHKQ